MSDRIVVMSNAEVQQVGTPAHVYYDPANLFVARFIGSPGMNLMASQYGNGIVRLPGANQYVVSPDWRMALGEGLDSDDVIIGFRPEAAHIKPDGNLVGEVYASELYGAYTMLHVELDGNEIVHIRSDRQTRYPIGSKVRFDLDPEMVRFFNPKTEMAIN